MEFKTKGKMTHLFEFVAKLNDGGVIHQMYKGESSRHKKVTKLILKDLDKLYNIKSTDIKEFYLKPTN